MAEVSFYHLERQSLEAALPKLLERVLAAGMRAVVRTPDEGITETLNLSLWTYDAASFLPHGTPKTGFTEDQPVYLTWEGDTPNRAEAQIIVNDAGIDPPEDYARNLFMFDGRIEAMVTMARERWKELSAAGHQLTYWQQAPGGGWKKKE